MARAELVTYQDLIEHCLDYLGANPSGEASRDARRAALAAMRALAASTHWTYYYSRFRLVTVAPYSTGTVEYRHTGGAYERLLTLTGGVWPDWSGQGDVRLSDSNFYEVADRKSDTQVTLSVNGNPGDDLADAAYSLTRDTFPLPVDLAALGALTVLNNSTILQQDHPSVWAERQRVYRGPAMPRFFCLRGDPNYLNTLSLSFFPAPDAAYSIDGVYERRPREMRVDAYTAGTVSITSGGSTLTGVGTSWPAKLAGSVMRVSGNKSLPTGRAGANPPVFERVVASVDSPTSITLDDSVSDTLGAVAYIASDPADVETGAMLNALLRGCESQIARSRRMSDRAEIEQDYTRELIRAREADSRCFQEQRVGGRVAFPTRLADMPRGPDIP